MNEVKVISTGMLIVSGLKETVSLAGSAADPYTVRPSLLVISTRLIPPEVLAASVTVAAVTVSVPLSVWSVKVSSSVATAPGAIGALAGLVPSAIVVVSPQAVGGEAASALISAALNARS